MVGRYTQVMKSVIPADELLRVRRNAWIFAQVPAYSDVDWQTIHGFDHPDTTCRDGREQPFDYRQYAFIQNQRGTLFSLHEYESSCGASPVSAGAAYDYRRWV
jgi:hypothetical protein